MESHAAHFKICPGCNYFCLKDDPNEYCPFCGEKLIEKCPECDAEITTPYARFCPICGTLYPGREIKNEVI